MKKALMLASVASMIDQFNMSNIEILLSLGYEVDVVADFTNPGNITNERAEDLKRRLDEKRVHVIDIPIPRSINPSTILSSYRLVREIIYKKNYNLIHCHSPIGGAICRFAARKAREKGTRVIYTAHGFHFYSGAPLKNWLIFYPIEKWMSKYTDVLITINKEDYERANRKLQTKHIFYVPGIGVDTEKFSDVIVDRRQKREEIGLDEDDTMVFSVGELNNNKNHSIVIDAIARTRNNSIHYVIAGKGSLEEALKKKAGELDVNLHLLGYRTDVAELYKCADVFVLPSHREGLNVSLMEAMASGLPCVVSKIRGNVDLIDEPHVMFESRDAKGFSDGIIYSVQNKEREGKRNKKRILECDVKKINNMMEKIYKDV